MQPALVPGLYPGFFQAFFLFPAACAPVTATFLFSCLALFLLSGLWAVFRWFTGSLLCALLFCGLFRSEAAAHGFGSSQQRALIQMGIAHGGARVSMAEQLLYLIERMPFIDQKTGKGMAQVMDAHTLQAQALAYPVPVIVKVRKRPGR